MRSISILAMMFLLLPLMSYLQKQDKKEFTIFLVADSTVLTNLTATVIRRKAGARCFRYT